MSTTGRFADGAATSTVLVRRVLSHLATWILVLARAPRGRGAGRLLPATRLLIVGATVAVAMIIAAMLFADDWSYQHQRFLPAWLVSWGHEITDFGKAGWFLWPLGVLILASAAIASPALERFANLVLATVVVRLGFLFLAIGLPGLVVTIGKRLIGRVRPSALGPFRYVPFSWRSDYAGMPSGHAASAFAAAFAIGSLYPRLRAPMWIYAGIIALSRVVVDAHYPSDVIAAAFAGSFGALVVRNWFAMRQLGFSFRPDGTVAAFPGPSLRRIRGLARRIAGH